MIGFETTLGVVEISQEYFANLIGQAASECYGVAGMINSPYQDLRSRVLRRDAPDKGVRVRNENGKLTVDIHIARLRQKLGLRGEIRAVMRKGYALKHGQR